MHNSDAFFGGVGVGGGTARGTGGGIHRTVDKDDFMHRNPGCRDIEMSMTP